MSWVTTDDARTHLDKLSTLEDAELQHFIDAACTAIADRMGPVDVETIVDETHRADRAGRVILDRSPVLTVSAVTRLVGNGVTAPVDADDPVAGVRGWRLVSSGGVLTIGAPWWHVQVSYAAGRDPVPENYRLAALELTGHLWRASKLNAGGGRTQQGDTDQIVPGLSSAFPYRVRELLGLNGALVRDEVFLA